MTATVRIVAPSSPFDTSRFEAGLALLVQLGLTVDVPDAARLRRGFLAGDDERRFEAFAEAWRDDAVDVIMAARGGYGAHRLLPRFETLGPSPNKKRVVGFSDITAIHAWLYRRGLPGVHGPVVTQLGTLSATDLDHLNMVLTGDWKGLVYTADGPTIAPGIARGRVFGGCLSVITPLLGTPYAPDFENMILLLEDVGEPPYRVDRLLTHLRLAGALERIAGVAIGDFEGSRETREGYPDVGEVLIERLGDLGVPVLAGLPFGHGSRNQAIPVGVAARLDADAKTLTIEGNA